MPESAASDRLSALELWHRISENIDDFFAVADWLSEAGTAAWDAAVKAAPDALYRVKLLGYAVGALAVVALGAVVYMRAGR